MGDADKRTSLEAEIAVWKRYLASLDGCDSDEADCSAKSASQKIKELESKLQSS